MFNVYCKDIVSGDKTMFGSYKTANEAVCKITQYYVLDNALHQNGKFYYWLEHNTKEHTQKP